MTIVAGQITSLFKEQYSASPRRKDHGCDYTRCGGYIPFMTETTSPMQRRTEGTVYLQIGVSYPTVTESHLCTGKVLMLRRAYQEVLIAPGWREVWPVCSRPIMREN
jgi:hypothetical protein